MLNRRLLALIAVISAVVLGLTLVDLLREPTLPPIDELAIDLTERLLLVAAMVSVAWTVDGLRDLREGQVALANNLARSVAQGDAWREQRRGEIAALGKAIESQFAQWGLSAAETDVAGLMLKGASLKEIALARDTSEATIRQQAQSIYRKSGLSGRAELSAYFLESLFDTAENGAGRRPNLVVVSTD
jgi:DNA-binding NarL/FixJ family response regulator